MCRQCAKGAGRVERGNAELQIECEILLHILTVSEINKLRLQKEFALRDNIAESRLIQWQFAQ
jgi:hypothetical protein